jgi:hypothetical protein
MSALYPVNSISSSAAISQDSEPQGLMARLLQEMAQEEGVASKLMTALKAVITQLQSMMSSNAPISPEQISAINGQVCALTDAFEKNENAEENTENSLIEMACSNAGKESPALVKAAQKLSTEIQQQIVAEKKQFGDLLNRIEAALQTLKDAKGTSTT